MDNKNGNEISNNVPTEGNIQQPQGLAPIYTTDTTGLPTYQDTINANPSQLPFIRPQYQQPYPPNQQILYPQIDIAQLNSDQIKYTPPQPAQYQGELPNQIPSNQPYPIYIYNNNNALSVYSTKLMCPHCNKVVDTLVSYEANSVVWLLAILLCIFTGCICFFVPFLFDEIKDAVHHCPTCRNEIARKERFN